MVKFQVWTFIPSGKPHLAGRPVPKPKYYDSKDFESLDAALEFIKKGEKLIVESGYCFEVKVSL